MAYDRYVAICNPLLYSVVMSQKVCRGLAVMPYMISFTNSLVSLCVISRLAFCDVSINHFFCDTTALLALSCMDAFNTEMVIFVLAGFTLLSSLFIITVTHMAIISAILQIRPAAGRQKAFSTCVSHIMGGDHLLWVPDFHVFAAWEYILLDPGTGGICILHHCYSHAESTYL